MGTGIAFCAFTVLGRVFGRRRCGASTCLDSWYEKEYLGIGLFRRRRWLLVGGLGLLG